jgi:F-type H+-transporting ATPase subunit a
MAAESGINPILHVVDSYRFELPFGIEIPIPAPFTKFEILVLASAVTVFAAFTWVAKRIATGEPPRGRLWNFLEMVLLFIRDQVVRPSIGEHDYKRYLPFIWTVFFFILVMNLLGMVPFLGSATASLAVTIVLAAISFIVTHYNGIVANHGFRNYMKTFVPHIESKSLTMRFMKFCLFWMELLGVGIRGVVLAIRLFANMLAGHTALVVVLSFITMAAHAADAGSSQAQWFYLPITISSLAMVVMLSLLELFVACLQAFIFTFLTSIFIGLAIHPQH